MQPKAGIVNCVCKQVIPHVLFNRRLKFHSEGPKDDESGCNASTAEMTGESCQKYAIKGWNNSQWNQSIISLYNVPRKKAKVTK